MNPDIFGAIAATLTTIAFLPQLLKVLRERDTSAISLGMYCIFTTGVLFWFIYGIMLMSLPMIIANALTFAMAFYILVMKIRLG